MRDPQRDKFVPFAEQAIEGLEKIKNFKGKQLINLPLELRKLTTSYVDTIIIGLGSGKIPEYNELVDKLESLKVNAITKEKSAKYRLWQGLFENAEMAQSDVNKIVKYSDELQSMFDVNDNLEDWVKAKLNHACDYVATVRDYLKFYRDEKEAGTPVDQIDEKWSNKYKKTINCSNPKGFSQKAHCRARKLRQAGKHTSSKPVREIYKEVTNQLLKEFNSSMAMGALKQINNDAKELESMLQPTVELEDWVKAKLNLAGEYLDDVYHHLDHFGTEGRKLDKPLKESGYIKRIWFTPDGKAIDAGDSHEKWIIDNDKSIKVGPTLIHTYDNAVDAGYVRGIYDYENKFLTLSNVQNYELLMSNLNGIVKNAIGNFVKDKNIRLVATGRGRLIKDFDKYKTLEPEYAGDISEEIETMLKLQEGWKDWVAAAAIGASTLGANAGAMKTPVVKPAIVASASSIDSDFINYMKDVENGIRKGYDKNKKLWFPHKSVEGGSDTIAYGHKIQPGENFSKGLTDSQAHALLLKDLEKARYIVYKELGNVKLTKKQEQMFIDFVFNMNTLRKFPKFKDAVLKNDMTTMRSQFKRYSGGKELKNRNVAFLSRFLKEYFGFNYYFEDVA